MKLTREENFHVKAFPGYCSDNKQALSECRQIEQEIHKHCDSIANTDVDWDTVEFCEFCHNEWEENDAGEPVCCEAAVVDWERSRYCYNCFEKTFRAIKREDSNWYEASKAIRCDRCKRYFCSACFDWRSSGLCSECKNIVEEQKRREAEEKNRPPGRKVRR